MKVLSAIEEYTFTFSYLIFYEAGSIKASTCSVNCIFKVTYHSKSILISFMAFQVSTEIYTDSGLVMWVEC